MTKDEALDLALELRELADRFSEGWHDGIKIDASDIMLLSMAASQIEQASSAPVQEPVATLWQHGETGRTRITMPGDITDCDARWFKAADLYTTPPAAPVQEPVWIQPDHLQKAKTAPFLCRVEPNKRDDFVPLYTTPPAAQRQWVGLMRGVRVEGDTVVITAKGGNDAARELCAALIQEKNT